MGRRWGGVDAGSSNSNKVYGPSLDGRHLIQKVEVPLLEPRRNRTDHSPIHEQ